MQGDEQAFRQVFDMQLNSLTYFAQSLLERRDEADDVVSASFFKLWQRRANFSTMSGIRSFLYTTVRNQCFDLLKHREVVLSAHKQMEVREEMPSFESAMYQGQLIELIYTEIQLLPERPRNILTWSFLEDLSTADIAKRLGLKESSVRSEKTRALVQLRSVLRNRDLWQIALALFASWPLGKN